MDQDMVNKENISTLIDQLLKAKDPAEVGLKKILRKKVDQFNDYPLHTPELEEFSTSEKNGVLNVDERSTLELQKRVGELEEQLKSKEESARKAVQNAYNKGKQEGLEQGKLKGKETADAEYAAEIQKIQDNVTAVLNQLQSSKKELLRNSEHTLLRLCVQIVKKIIANEVCSNEKLILGVLKKALRSIAEKDRLIIRISPQDLQTVKGGREFWVSVTERLKDVSIEDDERIQRGGCIIESVNGIVDARLDVQIDEITTLLENMWQADISEDCITLS
ncbi:Flagellar assembly protein FliH [Chitinispirillum alkaliphilum]|nr:Flagellar assembly protein FliH [Chitinispirillum alkaliphilum]